MSRPARAIRNEPFGRRALLGGIGAATLLAATKGRAARLTGERPVATVPTGRMRGGREGGISSFKGIPYGDTTAGDGRYRPPRGRSPGG